MRPKPFSDLSGLRPGDEMVHVTRAGRTERVKVAKVGRIWLTDAAGLQYRIDDGDGKGDFDGRAYTVADYELNVEIIALTHKMVAWGWSAFNRGADLTLDQMRQAGSLLAAFEAAADPKLPHVLADHVFAKSGCRYDEAESVWYAMKRGYAAHAAEDLVEVLRAGDMQAAGELLNAVRRYYDEYNGRKP